MGGSKSKDVNYCIEVSESSNPQETGIYRHPKQVDGVRSGYIDVDGKECNQLQQGFLAALRKYPSSNCMGSRSQSGKEGPFTFKSFSQVDSLVRQIGSGILHLDLAPSQDTYKEHPLRFIGIYGKNSEDWIMSDMAANFYGITSVAIYDTLGAESMSYILSQTGLSTLFLATGMLKNIASQDKLDTVNNLVYFDMFDTPEQSIIDDLKQKGYNVIALQSVKQAGQEHPCDMPLITSEMISTISYTSGTTGNPKGVMLSHGNIVSTLGGLTGEEFNLEHEDMHLSYLPMAHIFERLVVYCCLLSGGAFGMYSGDMLKLKQDMQELKPTIFVSVPRLYNRFYDLIKGQFDKLTGYQKIIVNRGLKKKLSNYEHYTQLTHSIYDKMVFNKTKAVFGGRVRVMVTASAPISPDVLNFLRVATSCPILEGYGQTESTGGSYLTRITDSSQGHVGGPMPTVEFKIQAVPEMDYNISDKDAQNNLTPRGELMIRGSGIFQGYYKDIAKTEEALNKDGWLSTGDIVRLNANHSISIIDRKKNIFKLAQGEYVAAEKLEIGYRMMPEVEEAFIYGDSLQATLVVIIFPNEHKIRLLAEENNINVEDKSFEEVIQMSQIKEAMLKKIAVKAKELKFNGIETPRAIHMIPKTFSEYDCQTTSFKLIRHKAKNMFIKEIDAMYGK